MVGIEGWGEAFQALDTHVMMGWGWDGWTVSELTIDCAGLLKRNIAPSIRCLCFVFFLFLFPCALLLYSG